MKCRVYTCENEAEVKIKQLCKKHYARLRYYTILRPNPEYRKDMNYYRRNWQRDYRKRYPERRLSAEIQRDINNPTKYRNMPKCNRGMLSKLEANSKYNREMKKWVFHYMGKINMFAMS